jgi:hypothetical protein
MEGDMNERILLEESAVWESLSAADGGLTRPRSLDELKARLHMLFRCMDQEAAQRDGLEAVTRSALDPAGHWPQGNMISSLI